MVQSADGTRIALERTGGGPPVVLVDGALSHRGLGPQLGLAQALATDHTVIGYDRRGRGDSGDTSPYAVERELEDLAAVAAAAGEPPALVGISSGAVLALLGAAAGVPCSRLALYEPPLSPEPEDPDETEAFAGRLGQLLVEGRNGDAVAWFFTNAGVPEEALEGMRADPSWARFEAIAPTLGYDTAVVGDGGVPVEAAALVTAPTLVLNGAESPDFFAEGARAMAAAIPGARHQELPGQSWGQVDPVALAAALRPFLAGA